MNFQNIRKQISKIIERFLYFVEDHKKEKVRKRIEFN